MEMNRVKTSNNTIKNTCSA